MESIGKELKKIVKKRRVSFYRIAKDLGIAQESLYRSLLDGANPGWKRIKQILDYLDYDIVLRHKKKETKLIKSKPPRSRRKEKEGI
jgi:DNA-binding phage protein